MKLIVAKYVLALAFVLGSAAVYAAEEACCADETSTCCKEHRECCD